jgi:hypothetical protein
MWLVGWTVSDIVAYLATVEAIAFDRLAVVASTIHLVHLLFILLPNTVAGVHWRIICMAITIIPRSSESGMVAHGY